MIELLYHIYFLVNKKSRKLRWIRKFKIDTLVYLLFSYISSKTIQLKRIFTNNSDSGIYSGNRDKKIILSLTTFPARIDTIWICIETLMNQTIKPDKIILWLAESQFSDIDSLPKNLKKLIKRGLTIKFCEDLRSHKKYYYSFKEYPNDIIITVDDDVLYPKNMIEELIKLNNIYPNDICCNRGQLMITDKYGNILPYNMWKLNPQNLDMPSKYLCPTGVGGVLYPPNSVDPEVFNKDSIINLCYYADDIWLKFMSIKNKTRVVRTDIFNGNFFTIPQSQKEALGKININQNMNDAQIEKILTYYKLNIN